MRFIRLKTKLIISEITVQAKPINMALSVIQLVIVTVSAALAPAVTIPPPAAVIVEAVAA